MSQDRIHKILDPEVDLDQEALDSFECGADVNLNELTIGTQLYYLYNEADTNTQSWYWGCIIEIDESRKHGEIYHIYHDDEDPFIDLSKDRNDWKRIAPHSLYFDREFKRNSNSEKSQSPPSHSQPPTVAKRSNKKPSKNTKNSSTKNDIKNSNSKSVKIGEHGIVCIVPNQPMACTVIGGPLACEAVKLECDWLPLTLKYAFWARKSDIGETEKLHAQEPQVSFVLNGQTGRYRVINECASPSQTRTFVQCRWADIHAPTWIAVSDFYSISDTTATIAANNQKRKRGRPKGSKNKKRKTDIADIAIADNQNSTPQSTPALQHAPPPLQSIISTSTSTASKNSNSNSETRAQSAVLKSKSDSESKKRYQMLANQRHSFFVSNHVGNSAMQPPRAQPQIPQPHARQNAQFGICENHVNHVNQFTHAHGNVYAIYYPSSHYMHAAPPPPPQQPQQQQAQSSLRVVTLQQLQTLQRIQQQQQQQQQQQNRVVMPTQPAGRTRGVKRSASHMMNDAHVHVQADKSARKRQRMSTPTTQQQPQQQSAQQQQLYLFAPQIHQIEQRVCSQMPPLQKETETDASSMDTGDSVAAAYACIGKQTHSELSSQQQQACHRNYCSSSAPPPVSASSPSALSTDEDESNAFASFRDLAVLPLQHITRQLSDANMSTEDRLCALQGILKYVTNCQKYLCQFSHQYANVVQCVQAIITDLQRQDS